MKYKITVYNLISVALNGIYIYIYIYNDTIYTIYIYIYNDVQFIND